MKKLVVAGVAVVLVMAGVLVALLGPWPCRVTRANCERIKEGMTRAEVEAILGGPPGDYRTRPNEADAFAVSEWRGEVWSGDEGHVWLDFVGGWVIVKSSIPPAGPGDLPTVEMAEGGGVVGFREFVPVEPYVPGLVELLRWRLGRLKERWLS